MTTDTQNKRSIPHQLTRDEFIAWWNELDNSPEGRQSAPKPQVIYLGQDADKTSETPDHV